MYYFGTDWREALAKFKAQREALYAGEDVQVDSGGLTLRELCNAFLAGKEVKRGTGELSARHFDDLRSTARRLVEVFDGERSASSIGPVQFSKYRSAMAKRWGPSRLATEIARVRSIFTYGYKSQLLPAAPAFGPDFVKPSKKTMRLAKQAKGENLFTAAEIRLLIESASPAMKAMILLGINAALQGSDFGSLTTQSVDLSRGWIDFPRHKTGVSRLVPLWAETIEAIEAAVAVRPAPKPQCNNLLLVTERGSAWWASNTFTVGRHFKRLTDSVDMRGGRGFATLRHTHRTVSDGARDQVAAMATSGLTPTACSSTEAARESLRITA